MMLSVMPNQKSYLFRRNQLRVPIIFESVFQEGTKKKGLFYTRTRTLGERDQPRREFFFPAGDKNRHMNRDPGSRPWREVLEKHSQKSIKNRADKSV